jgi:hypothetical protein
VFFSVFILQYNAHILYPQPNENGENDKLDGVGVCDLDE